ncbi:hypothetical protein MmiEs2_10510 [Methanimicrococcus stummii]|uniref:ATP-binding protein n=1 Tax=Methanimicrococcus stummii TaxID=3028294 RepID=A0AA96V9U9_9EURY|nr:ATP-binding protein [Methanimicrococcus sp. Es2]WNY28843.1 hypothetical protein MmiEs2_10510 [Methanimicrococcus sp. Es2]
MVSVADGSPTKEFFISMLTRDIELNDAILDLLDNCLDGVVRIKGSENKRDDLQYYSGYEAHIVITSTSFSIKDNCGGIPRKIAEENAFRMGSTSTTNTGSATVGIYGIGMKRAIFKIGKTANVITKHNEKVYRVDIEKNWADKNEWSFPISDLSETEMDLEGTHISITDLNEGIKIQWDSESELNNFVDHLRADIKACYSLIIEKGFHITINGLEIDALPTQLLVSKDNEFKPYIYQCEYGDVFVKVIIGFYAPLISDEEIDDENESKRSSGDAGYTIICNDRVVLYNDKSHLTGWGVAGIPRYHTQFIGIKGFVIFESNNPANLPMTTTKRGIDLSSPIYSDVKDRMMEGLRLFIGYTNSWKGRLQQEKQYSKNAESLPYTKILDNSSKIQDTYGIKLSKTRTTPGVLFKPKLPEPPNEKKYINIRYTKPVDEIDILKRYFYNELSDEAKPSTVGEKSFDKVLEIARGTKK